MSTLHRQGREINVHKYNPWHSPSRHVLSNHVRGQSTGQQLQKPNPKPKDDTTEEKCDGDVEEVLRPLQSRGNANENASKGVGDKKASY